MKSSSTPDIQREPAECAAQQVVHERGVRRSRCALCSPDPKSPKTTNNTHSMYQAMNPTRGSNTCDPLPSLSAIHRCRGSSCQTSSMKSSSTPDIQREPAECAAQQVVHERGVRRSRCALCSPDPKSPKTTNNTHSMYQAMNPTRGSNTCDPLPSLSAIHRTPWRSPPRSSHPCQCELPPPQPSRGPQRDLESSLPRTLRRSTARGAAPSSLS